MGDRKNRSKIQRSLNTENIKRMHRGKIKKKHDKVKVLFLKKGGNKKQKLLQLLFLVSGSQKIGEERAQWSLWASDFLMLYAGVQFVLTRAQCPAELASFKQLLLFAHQGLLPATFRSAVDWEGSCSSWGRAVSRLCEEWKQPQH